MKKLLIMPLVVAMALAGCKQAAPSTTLSGLEPAAFADTVNSKPVALYTLSNKNGIEVCITNYGGRIVSIMTPDRTGTMRDIVLGFDNLADYLPNANKSDFGAAIGRYANRINQGKITIDSVEYQLPKNNYGHCLHGGPKGWQYRVYEVTESTPNSLTMVMHSPDGDAKFPGAVEATVNYTLTDQNEVKIAYSATTDRPTVINMTNHSYFNLSGDPSQDILGHLLTINADTFTPCDSTFMTTGEILPVEGTPMDFRTPKAIGAEINNYEFEQLKNGNGYDHNWVLNTAGDMNTLALKLYSPETGIGVEVYTDEPGVQVYTGNFLDGTVTGKKGIVYNQRAAVCMETQHYPDSPNKADWPSVVLRPGETYQSHCTYKLTVE